MFFSKISHTEILFQSEVWLEWLLVLLELFIAVRKLGFSEKYVRYSNQSKRFETPTEEGWRFSCFRILQSSWRLWHLSKREIDSRARCCGKQLWTGYPTIQMAEAKWLLESRSLPDERRAMELGLYWPKGNRTDEEVRNCEKRPLGIIGMMLTARIPLSNQWTWI